MARSGTPAMDTYERTYSQLLETLQANDHAIACALAEEQAAGAAAPRPDTSLDGQIALQLYEKEAEKLVRPPKRRHRKRKALHRLLGHLAFTKVIPRLNPAVIPSPTYISRDRERLLLRLDMYALQERQVTGDGNCQFRAIADQLWLDQNRHEEVRSQVVQQLCQQPERYRDYVTTDYAQYISSMSSVGTWGDHITLQAAADAFHVRICIVSSFLENCVISINPSDQPEEQQQQPPVTQLEDVQQQLSALPQLQSPKTSDKTVWLAFWAEVHYNSIAAKAPEAPSDVSSDDEGSASSSSSSSSESGRTRRRNKLLGPFMHAADCLGPGMLRT